MTVLLLVCFTQSWLLWKFIRFQLRRWREFRHEQAIRKKTAPKQPLRTLKRDSCEYILPYFCPPFYMFKSWSMLLPLYSFSPSWSLWKRSRQSRERNLPEDQKTQITVEVHTQPVPNNSRSPRPRIVYSQNRETQQLSASRCPVDHVLRCWRHSVAADLGLMLEKENQRKFPEPHGHFSLYSFLHISIFVYPPIPPSHPKECYSCPAHFSVECVRTYSHLQVLYWL